MSDDYVVRDRATEGAYNQALFRVVNERLREILDDPLLSQEFGPGPSDPDWVCECANVGCMHRVSITSGEYAAIRSDPARFLVAAGDEHVFLDIEEITQRNDAYWVVETTGHARTVAQELAGRR